MSQAVLALRSPFTLVARLSLASKIVIALGTVYLVWGSTLFATKVALATLPPFSLQAIRFLIAGALLYVIAERRGDRHGDRVTLRQWGQAFITGNLLLVGGTGLITLAQVDLPSGTAGLLLATVPIWLALLARGIFGERLSARAWIGLAVGLVGVGLLLEPSGGGHLGAMFIALLGAFAWAAGSLRSRVNDAPARPLVAAAMQMLCGGVGFLGLALVRGEVRQIEVGALDLASLLAFLYLLTAGSLVAFTAYSWLLRNVSTTLVGTYAYVNPAVAVLLGWLLAGEIYSAPTLLAGGVILGAVVLIVTGRPGEPVPAQATSGGDVFAGERRWHQVRRQLGRLPSAARLYRQPGAPQYRGVGYEQPVASTVMASDEIHDLEAERAAEDGRDVPTAEEGRDVLTADEGREVPTTAIGRRDVPTVDRGRDEPMAEGHGSGRTHGGEPPHGRAACDEHDAGALADATRQARRSRVTMRAGRAAAVSRARRRRRGSAGHRAATKRPGVVARARAKRVRR